MDLTPEISDDMIKTYADAHDDAWLMNTFPKTGESMWPYIRAGLEAVAPKIRESAYRAGREDAARGAIDPADLRTVLDQRMLHSHTRPGIWDADNRPGLANTACVECAARGRLMRALEELISLGRSRQGAGDNPEGQQR